MDVKELWGRAKNLAPSLFDVGVISFVLLVTFWRSRYEKNLIYVFGGMALWGLSLRYKPRRIYNSLPLSLFLLWSLTNIWFHAWDKDLLKGITSKYLNVCLLSESFIFIFVSILLLRLIVIYTKHFEYYYPVLTIAFIPWVRRIIHHGSMTQLIAIPIAFVIYGFLNKKWRVALLALLSGTFLTILNWKWFWFKFHPRPLVWRQLWDEFLIHPFIGGGYWRALDFDKGDMIWVKYDLYGPLYRHNDYLNAGCYIGFLGIVFISWWILQTIWKIRKSKACIAFLICAIIPFFQMTMLELYKAMMITIIAATSITASYDTKI